MKEAVEKGGWESADDVMRVYDCDGHDSTLLHELALLSPSFWQALGRARGWSEHNHLKRWGEEIHSWYAQMHNFIDHLANGNDAESFFKAMYD